MRANPLPEDADALVRFAKEIATILSKKHDELGLSRDVEELLRSSIADAVNAIDAWLVLVDGAKKWPVAPGDLIEAKARCDRELERLRRRLARSVGHLCRFIDYSNVLTLARYVVSIGA